MENTQMMPEKSQNSAESSHVSLRWKGTCPQIVEAIQVSSFGSLNITRMELFQKFMMSLN